MSSPPWFQNLSTGCAACMHVVNAKATTWLIVCSFILCTASALEEVSPALEQCCPAASDPSLDAHSAGSGAPLPRMAFIIGAMKAGTTFLFDELVKRHPAIVARTVDEGREHMVRYCMGPLTLVSRSGIQCESIAGHACTACLPKT